MKTKMTNTEKRVLIAKDVIKLIKAKKIVVESGKYFKLNSRYEYVGKQLNKVLPKIKKCEVCALGGLFYSYVMKYNNYEIDENGINYIGKICNSGYEMRDLLKSIFSEKQLYLIECAFEESDINENCESAEYSYETIERAVEYKEKHELDDDSYDKLLIHIMKNIIKNKGVFKV